MIKSIRGLLSDAVEAVSHNKANADQSISEFSEHEALMADLYKQAHYYNQNIVVSSSKVQEREIGRVLETKEDADQFLEDPEVLKNRIQTILEHIQSNNEAYNGITANDVMEFANGLDHRVKNRILHPERAESTQELDTLS